VAADINQDTKVDLLAATVDNAGAPYESKIAVLLGDGRAFKAAPGTPLRWDRALTTWPWEMRTRTASWTSRPRALRATP
jgi:hypothetical protein